MAMLADPASPIVWQRVLEALAILDEGLLESVHNSQFRLLQLQLYGWIGAVAPVAAAFNGLRPKHMQVLPIA